MTYCPWPWMKWGQKWDQAFWSYKDGYYLTPFYTVPIVPSKFRYLANPASIFHKQRNLASFFVTPPFSPINGALKDAAQKANP
jgi:hypothetical protein